MKKMENLFVTHSESEYHLWMPYWHRYVTDEEGSLDAPPAMAALETSAKGRNTAFDQHMLRLRQFFVKRLAETLCN